MAEILPGVHLIEGLGDSPGAANVYLLLGESLTLVDAGLPGSHKAIAKYVNAIGHKLEDIQQIFITHAHPDHAGGAPALKQYTDARVYVHRGDTATGRSGRSIVSYGVFGRLPFKVPLLQQVEADVILEDHDWLPLMGGLKVHHTPGHTNGSVCYELRELGVLLTGDLFLINGHTLQKNHAYPGSSRDAYQQSIERIATLDSQWLCPGHGAPLPTTQAEISPTLFDPQDGYDWTWNIFAR